MPPIVLLQGVARAKANSSSSKLALESLTALGADRLARLVLEEAEANPTFRKLAKAALAGASGSDAVAKLVDRRLTALEKARATVDWRKERAFADELAVLVRMMTGELAQQDSLAAAERLLRFAGTHGTVFERIDDSSGRIQGVYGDAVADSPRLFAAVAETDRASLSSRLVPMLSTDTHGLTNDLIGHLTPLLALKDLAAFGKSLGELHAALSDKTPAEQQGRRITPSQRMAAYDNDDWLQRARLSIVVIARQIVADAMGDADLFIALENEKLPHMRDTHAIAFRLQKAGRAREALQAIRMEGLRDPDVPFDPFDDRLSHLKPTPLSSLRRVRLEAEILASLGEKPQAQELRWRAFMQLLEPDLLKEHIAAADDFAEFDIMDRAFACADTHPDPYRALAFYNALPDLRRAAALVIARQADWDGSRYYELPPAAAVLEADQPLAASILYRALMMDIFNRARSKAYGHAARYLAKLEMLAEEITNWPAGVIDHRTFRADIGRSQARKAGFWALVKDK